MSTDDAQTFSQENSEWECEKCSYSNRSAALVCRECRQPRPSGSGREDGAGHRDSNFGEASLEKHAAYSTDAILKLVPQIKPNIPSSASSMKTHSSSAISSTSEAYLGATSDMDHKPKLSSDSAIKHGERFKIPVYMSEIPSGIEDDNLAALINDRIEKVMSIKVHNVKCYKTLGVGSLYVADKETREKLTEDIGKIFLDPKEGIRRVSFVDTLELVSYVVVNFEKDMKTEDLPTSEQVSRRWQEVHKGEKPLLCEKLNYQFPNIYRIVTGSLEEIIQNLQHKDIRIKDKLAIIYFCADCSFLEDLPRTVTKDQLKSAIIDAVRPSKAPPPTSLHIQVNSETGSVCILAADMMRELSTKSSLVLNGKEISKKDTLACRLIIRSIPKSFPIETIIKHKDFAGKVANYKHLGDHLIIELADKNLFDGCIQRGSLRVSDKHVFIMEATNTCRNPEEGEIDAETWYETEMTEYKPDIMQFLGKPDSPIFRYKWNSKAWLSQWKKLAVSRQPFINAVRPIEGKISSPDYVRHQLQVTVMLNTLGVVRRRRYMIGDREIQLNLSSKLKTIVYNHNSTLEKNIKLPLKPPPYSKTKVNVVQDDCVAVYEKLVNMGKRPVLLNMASATSPGGGFRKGDGAQEENLFRRSDYFRSLDIGLDCFLPEKPERLQYSSTCQLEPVPDITKMYPMDEFGSIYTSGITFFRYSQDVGYEFMEKPLENACAIAVAAYRDPKLDRKMLSPKYATGTQRKLENLFSIAYHQNHDSIVLSAFGCGAFHNPPEHVAQIFASVIDQYAGFFESISFAIIDDHNTGQRLNPDGNFKPFAALLDGYVAKPLSPMDKGNTKFGPYRLSSDGSKVHDISIGHPTLCHFAAQCEDISDAQHASQYAHPPLCPYAAVTGKCDLTSDMVHMNFFVHRNQCKYGGQCRSVDDKKHAEEFEHPSYCPQGGLCENMDEDHLKLFRHLPLCKDGKKCLDYQKRLTRHNDAFRHCTSRCPYGNQCVRFHDRQHVSELKHPFPSPCQYTPFQCKFHRIFSETANIQLLSKEIQQHCLDFAHVCRFGRNCTDDNPLHMEKSIHIARCICPFGDKCKKLNQEEHLNSYTHPKVADIRYLCNYGNKCHERHKLEHISKFSHPISYEDSGIVQHDSLNENINFVQNQKAIVTRVLDFVQNQNWKPLPSGSVPPEILNWIHIVQPVHRCNPVIFESILLHGHVMSRDYMEHLKKLKFVVNSVLQHSRVRHIDNLHIPEIERLAREYITALVSAEFEKAGFPPPAAPAGAGGAPAAAGAAPAAVGAAPAKPHNPTSAEVVRVIKIKENLLAATISPHDLSAVKTKAIEIAQASIKLHSNPAGIGHAPDKALGTDKHVFSVLGPHLGHYYGDVFIIFKREILHHPDADFSIQAATSFASGNAYKWRPWLGADPNTAQERINLYHNSKLNASIPGYDYALATELLAVTSQFLKRKSMDIDLQTVLKRWCQSDSHQNIEAHLPQLISLDYIDHIYIPKNLYDGLSASARKAIEAVFKGSISITEHTGEASQPMGPSGPVPQSKQRAEYQTYVVEQLMKQYDQLTHFPPAIPIQGACITIRPTEFIESYLLPLTISQAYEQYTIAHHHPPKESIVYIYWQTMNRDMMLVVSHQPPDSGEKGQPQHRSLLCYIASKCLSSEGPFFENATYINYGQPIQHSVFVSKNQYRAKSNMFHIGCNNHGCGTYCLEIHRSTGRVVLRHAGSNAIYSQEEISYDFKKSELDLTKLEFISVSAGSHKVSIRNLMVHFEKQEELHPTFDAKFKKEAAGPSKSAHEASASSSSGDHAGVASSLTPCRDNVNCLLQYQTGSAGKHHIATYSHPCRFSELCHGKEPHLTHDPHSSVLCTDGNDCKRLTDPFHRAKYRHKNLPDFLVPCRQQKKCTDKSAEHRMKYSHGEKVYEKEYSEKPKPSSEHPSADHRPACKWGAKCKNINDPDHKKEFSHPKAAD